MESDNEKIDILSLSCEELTAQLTEMGEKGFRAAQVYEWLHIKRTQNFNEMSNIPLELRTKLSTKYCIKRLIIVKRLESAIDNTIKYLYRLSDGEHIEAVLMEYHHGNSLCISTQVGCKMGCKFCASTIAGFRRSLMPSEMLEQIYEAERDSGRRVDSLVLMGIGEPLDNYDNVVKFLQLLSDKRGKNMSLRHVSLSTCGIAPKIYELAQLKLGLTLSVSLHAADNESRSSIMPVNKVYPIEDLIEVCRQYYEKTGRRISFEYAVINGVNDSLDDAKRLASLLKGMNCHINLIPVNKIKERSYKADRRSVTAFAEALTRLGMNATVRRTLGADINAACGQLRREYEI